MPAQIGTTSAPAEALKQLQTRAPLPPPLPSLPRMPRCPRANRGRRTRMAPLCPLRAGGAVESPRTARHGTP